jgi:hypothetical protein
MRYVERNLAMILIVFLGLTMIAFAIWFFERRIARIERRMRPPISYLQRSHSTVKRIFQLR